jgi:hypothetical protein
MIRSLSFTQIFRSRKCSASTSSFAILLLLVLSIILSLPAVSCGYTCSCGCCNSDLPPQGCQAGVSFSGYFLTNSAQCTGNYAPDVQYCTAQCQEAFPGDCEANQAVASCIFSMMNDAQLEDRKASDLVLAEPQSAPHRPTEAMARRGTIPALALTALKLIGSPQPLPELIRSHSLSIADTFLPDFACGCFCGNTFVGFTFIFSFATDQCSNTCRQLYSPSKFCAHGSFIGIVSGEYQLFRQDPFKGNVLVPVLLNAVTVPSQVPLFLRVKSAFKQAVVFDISPNYPPGPGISVNCSVASRTQSRFIYDCPLFLMAWTDAVMAYSLPDCDGDATVSIRIKSVEN